MKRIFLLLLLPIALSAQTIKVHTINTGALINADNNDSTFVNDAIESQVRAFRSSTTQDTILTKWVYIEGLNPLNFSVNFRYTNVAGTDSVDLFIHLYHGIGTPDSTGFKRNTLTTGSTSNLNTFYTISDSSFATERWFSKYRFEIREGKDVQNNYVINVNHEGENKNPIIRDN